jgi:hypothetical protein
MATIDPSRERQRLIEFYRSQLDGELEKIAKQAYELTEIAREELRAELTRRNLTAQLVEHAPAPIKPFAAPEPGDPPPELPPQELVDSEGGFEHRALITIRRYLWLSDALLAKGGLDSAGIDSVLTDTNIIGLDWLWSNLMGGIRLKVSPEDVAEADQILKQPIPAEFDVVGVGKFDQPKCPKCGSLNINFQEVAPAAYLSLFLIPVPLHRRAWRCHSCFAEWEHDSANELETTPGENI